MKEGRKPSVGSRKQMSVLWAQRCVRTREIKEEEEEEEDLIAGSDNC